MSERFTPEIVDTLEKEFKKFIKEKDDILSEYHFKMNNLLQTYTDSVLHYETKNDKVRAVITGRDDKVFYSPWTTETVLSYGICGAVNGLLHKDTLPSSVDLRETFINLIKVSIDIIEEVSEEWSICIS